MACYRKGGCGPYEMFTCYECPASKPDYIKKSTAYLIRESDLKRRAIESASARLKIAKNNLERSNGGPETLAKKKRTVEVADYILKAVEAYEYN